jgi:citrate lyase subunit beta / citryl-CoA lyase
MAGAGIDVHPVRTILFVPANREDRMRKSLTLDTDAVIFDLESAIPRGEADVARAIVRSVIADHGAVRPRICVRISAVTTEEFTDDLTAAVHPNLAAVVLPQVVSADDVIATDAALGRAEAAAGVRSGSTIIIPLLETANALRTAYEIANSSPRIAYMGGATSRGGDLARSVGFRFTPEGEETLYLRSKALIDVRAADIANPISGLWGNIEDLDGLKTFARATRNLGYEGMMVIHPSHLAIVNEAFTPSAAELDEWQGIVRAMEQAEREGLGAIRLDGRLIDVAHVHTANKELARARRLGLFD